MKHDRMDSDCRRCGAPGSYFFSETITLSGVYNTKICVDCRNDWDEYIIPHPTRLARGAIEIASNMAFAMTCGDGVDRTDELKHLQTEQWAIEAQMRELAVAWVADTITRAG